MPNDSLEQIVKSENGNLPAQDHGIVSNNVILAGLTVRHKLLPHRYLLEGFVVEDYYFNNRDFNIQGNSIHYRLREGQETSGFCIQDDDGFLAFNKLIYSKLIVDGKNEIVLEYFKTDTFYVRNNSKNPKICIIKGDKHFLKQGSNTIWNEIKFEYYLYETTTSSFPECSANRVYALCKYYEDGEFKYSIFNLHEIVPE